MDIRRSLSVPGTSGGVSVALLLMRVVSGYAFTQYGMNKIAHPFDWMGPNAFAPPPLQALAAIAEFGGGIAWILGLLSPLASLGIACTMTVAMVSHIYLRGDPFVSLTGGPAYDKAAVYFCVALVLMCAGPGRFSLDRRLFGHR